MASYHITELLDLDESVVPLPTEDLVDLVRLGVGGTANSADQAIEVLIALGRDRAEAERHVHYCVTGEWG